MPDRTTAPARGMHEMTPREITETVRAGFAGGIGIEFTETTGDVVRAQWKLAPSMHQAHGIVHGGAYCTVVESLASIGASVWFGPSGRVVGVSNTTDFLRAQDEGIQFGEALPLHRGRSQQLWQVFVNDTHGILVARGQVRFQNLRKADNDPA
ncbi:PaaI family thioesterase [Amycolatopsis orientalis]|uniref:PaaI family thioesterase n=1 Tax=Amycolatopsis orientalis TaxID=31958 RepID=UPI00039FDCF6|nr:PaaI family thioesterase [Amycolatopsis orientalis]